MICVVLPMPTSVNKLYTGRRWKSAAYRAWEWEAKAALGKQPIAPIGGPFKVRIFVGRTKTSRDLDNLPKAVLDFLANLRWIPNDKYCESLLVEWADDVVGVQVEIEET